MKNNVTPPAMRIDGRIDEVILTINQQVGDDFDFAPLLKRLNSGVLVEVAISEGIRYRYEDLRNALTGLAEEKIDDVLSVLNLFLFNFMDVEIPNPSVMTTDEEEMEGLGSCTPSGGICNMIEEADEFAEVDLEDLIKKSKHRRKGEGIHKYPEVCELIQYEYSRSEEDHLTPKSKYYFTISKRYQPIELIGEGAYGYVLSARDSILKKKVAIKIIRGVFTRSVSFQKRILREILLLKHFQHENVIGLVDLIRPLDFKSFTDVAIVTDLMDTDLSKFLRKMGRLSENHTRFFIYEALKGLSFVHSAGVLHRDIKPENIIIRVKGDMEVKVCDFGLSRGIDFNEKQSTHYVVSRYYRSPELLMMWEKTSTSIDVWSMGCVFAEMLSREDEVRNRVLFRGFGWVDQLKRIVQLLGVPKDEELHGTSSSISYIQSLRDLHKLEEGKKKNDSTEKNESLRRKKKLREKYPEASDQAIDLLSKMLVFDATKRISARDALSHPYFKELYEDDKVNKNEGLVSRSSKFDFRFDQNRENTDYIKKMMFKEIMNWNSGYKEIVVNKDVVKINPKRE